MNPCEEASPLDESGLDMFPYYKRLIDVVGKVGELLTLLDHFYAIFSAVHPFKLFIQQRHHPIAYTSRYCPCIEFSCRVWFGSRGSRTMAYSCKYQDVGVGGPGAAYKSSWVSWACWDDHRVMLVRDARVLRTWNNDLSKGIYIYIYICTDAQTHILKGMCRLHLKPLCDRRRHQPLPIHRLADQERPEALC